MIFDTHCHLNDAQLLDKLDEVILEAKESGVTRFLVVGWNKDSSLKAIEIANKYEGIYAAIGFHPCDVFDLSEDDFNEVFSHINDPKVVAVGEIGLDYHWVKEKEKQEIQKEYFVRQIELANKYNLPISIHNREAFQDTLEILENHRPKHGGVMHCYSGSVELLQRTLDIGILIGLDGPLTFNNAKTPKEVCRVVPLDKLVLETDCPYLTPHPYRGTLNTPKYINLVLDEVARIKGLSREEVAAITTNNGLKLFGIK